MTSISVRPGVVDTDMQRDIREVHGPGMLEKDVARYHKLHKEGGLLKPEQPGHVIAKLAVDGPRDLTGRFLRYVFCCADTPKWICPVDLPLVGMTKTCHPFRSRHTLRLSKRQIDTACGGPVPGMTSNPKSYSAHCGTGLLLFDVSCGTIALDI